jgi:hypothetical protein
VGLAGWVNLKQKAVIELQGAQIRVLMGRIGKKRLLLSDDQRRRLAAMGCIPVDVWTSGGLLRSCYRKAS